MFRKDISNKNIFVKKFKIMGNTGLKVKKCFTHQNEPHTAKLSFSGVLKHFRENGQKTPLLSKRVFF